MTTSLDLDVKQLFKQTNKIIFNEQAQYVINIFVYPVLLSYHVIRMEKSYYARFSLLYMHNRKHY